MKFPLPCYLDMTKVILQLKRILFCACILRSRPNMGRELFRPPPGVG